MISGKAFRNFAIAVCEITTLCGTTQKNSGGNEDVVARIDRRPAPYPPIGRRPGPRPRVSPFGRAAPARVMADVATRTSSPPSASTYPTPMGLAFCPNHRPLPRRKVTASLPKASGPARVPASRLLAPCWASPMAPRAAPTASRPAFGRNIPFSTARRAPSRCMRTTPNRRTSSTSA